MFASKSYDKVGENTEGVNFDRVSSLIELGYLSGEKRIVLGFVTHHNVSLTASGAAILAEWNHLLEKCSLKGRILVQAEKAIWFGLGIAATLIVNFT